MHARYYDPVLGRFYSNDPLDALGHIQLGNSIAHGFNRYAYANNNPYKYTTDPDGKFVVLAPLVPSEIAALGKALGFVETAAAGYAGSKALNAYNESAAPDLQTIYFEQFQS
ncbi:hypothetical protein FBQ74_06420 [Salinimonas iocasae]|uniref:RHS repeat-associated core domain-containing protein n=2 Tax=Salinimonas iocasae TaxID=2572577 RepID=A0A5B7YI22_9ALTE|nr:hypothetical protein FBQ74_06420 [Salinimonas iocasae]